MSNSTLAFDIGIKNLAWCITTLSGERLWIRGWGNFNLLEGRETEQPTEAKAKCKLCSAAQKYTSAAGFTCGKHVPSSHPLLKDASGVVFQKIPSLPVLKTALLEKGVRPLPKAKEEIVTKLKEFYSVPIKKVKVPHAAAIDVSVMHDALRNFVQGQLKPFFKELGEVRLENQPVLKNPVMKTIQILLFATLRDALYEQAHRVPVFKLVHAGTKVKGKETGDKGYKARKDGSEARALEVLQLPKVHDGARWKQFFESHKKRSDLADAFCMCLDVYPVSAYRNA
jgi:hypothetical protein